MDTVLFNQEIIKIINHEPIDDYTQYTEDQLHFALQAALGKAQNFSVIRQIAALERDDKPDVNALLKQAILELKWKTVHALESALKTEDYAPTQGPLPKSIYTRDLEYIVRALMRGEPMQWQRVNDTWQLELPQQVRFNWTAICKWANIEHVELGPEDFALYTTYLVSPHGPKPNARPHLLPNKAQAYRDGLYSTYLKNQWTLPDPPISFQEMQAINVYTSEFYKPINALLRGELDLQTSDPFTVRAAIINAVLCASGLRRIPQTDLTDSYRRGSFKPKEHAAQVHAAAVGGVVSLFGFVSTSTAADEQTFSHKPVYMHFTHLKGADVACISQNPQEQEFLIPPTQVRITHYQHVHGEHQFEAEAVTDLNQLSPESLTPIVPTKSSWLNALRQFVKFNHRTTRTPSTTPVDWGQLITTSQDFAFFIQHVNASDQTAIMTYFDKQWDTLIESDAKKFQEVLEHLNPEQKKRVCDAHANRWNVLIRTPHDFAFVIHHVNDDIKTKLFNAFNDALIPQIKRSREFSRYIEYLRPDQQAVVFNAFNDAWSTLIKNGADFAEVVKDLTPELRVDLINTYQSQWGQLATNAYDIVLLQASLDKQQVEQLLDACHDQWPSLITDSEEFAALMQILPTPRQNEIIDALLNAWRANPEQKKCFVNTTDRFHKLMEHLNPEQRALMYTQVEGNLRRLINNIDTFNEVIQDLGAVQTIRMFDLIKTSLPKWIQNSSEFIETLSALPAKQAAELTIQCLADHSAYTPADNDIHQLPTTHQVAIYKSLLPSEITPDVTRDTPKPHD